MNKFRRAGSSLLSRLSDIFGRRGPSTASRLARRAGGSMPAEFLEQLEERRLLFSLTIGPDDVDPGTGLGTRTATFAYVAPLFFQELPDAQAPVTVTEEFADEMANWTTLNPAVPPNGTFFDESGIRISYSAQSATAIRLVVGPDPGQQGMADRDLRIQLSANDRVSFTFFDGVDENNPVTRLATNVNFTVRPATLATELPGDGDGLRSTNDGTRLELLLDGQVVATFIGGQLAALGTPAVGGGIQYAVAFAGGFDAIRFSSAQAAPDNAMYQDIFVLDDISVTFPGGRFAEFTEGRIFAARLTFTGPAGSSVQVLDLYGREMQSRIDLGIPEGSEIPNVDRNDDGIPDFNDGIGRIIISGSDVRTSMTLIGGTVEQMNNVFMYVLPDDVIGLYDEFEAAGFGYALTQEDPPQVVGLPPGPGSVIIGAPFLRDNSSPENYFNGVPILQPDDFVRGDQGISVIGGASMGSIVAHGLLHGSSNFTGALQRLNVGVLLGSVSVTGDLGLLQVGGDAALWVSDDDAQLDPNFRQTNPTAGQLVVGRTVREIAIGGRSALDITVLGDVNNAARPRLQFLDYFEREVMYRFTGEEVATLGTTQNRNANPATQATFFGAGFFRNDSLLSAEFIGYAGTSVRISGSLGGSDPVNTAGDASDVYAFAADPTREVVIQSDGAPSYYRIVDRDGRTLASSDLGAPGRGELGNNLGLSTIRFRPDYADVYYLVVNEPAGGVGNAVPYEFTVVGMAPVTLGALRTAAGSGGFGDPFFLNLGSGSMGSLRIGTGYIDGSAAENDTTEILNTNQGADDLFNFSAATISVPVNLYNVTTGSDINGAEILVGRDLGTLVTGLSPITGLAVTEGDLTNGNIRAGRRIGILDIRGALASDQDPDPDSRAGIVNIRSGVSGQPGHIGQILVGAYVNGLGLTITTSNNSIIDQFIVGANNGGAGSEFPGGQIINGTPVFRMGTGSDVRFADFNLIQRGGNLDVVTPLFYNTPITFVDDGGATFTVRIRGGGATGFESAGEIRVLPIDGSQGVAFARINVNLVDGAELVFTGQTPGVVSLGQLNITAGSNAPSVIFNGVSEIDVWRIESQGLPLNVIRNETTNGDIVAIDALALREVRIATGDLGRTQTSGAGPSRIGPWLGLAQGRDGGVGGPLGVSGAAIDGIASEGADWDGSIFVDITAPDYMPASPLEDVGSPIDGYLDGVVVRGGDLQNVDIGGAVGDVIVEGGHLIRLVANADGVAPTNVFQGIFGNVYAVAINVVDVGQGLLGTGPSPFAAAGIFADDDIILVTGTNATISGVIIAANIDTTARTTIGTENPTGLQNPVFGLNNVTLTNGRFDEAYMASVPLDDFWQSGRVRDVNYWSGQVRLIRGVNSDLFGSFIRGIAVVEVNITGGAYDGTFVAASANIGTVNADQFRNSTRLGRPEEIRPSRIEASLNIQNVLSNGLAGDVADLEVIAGGTLFGSVSGRNLARVSILVNNEIFNVIAANDVRSTTITAGSVRNLSAGGDIRSSSINVAGPILQMIAAGEITLTEILSNGPDGRIDLVRSTGRMQGVLSSSGPIGTIESLTNDVEMTISSTDASDGRLTRLAAGRDLLIDLQILGNADTIIAGRNIGRPTDGQDRALDIRGDLGSITATNGQIYNDILVGQAITGTVRASIVSAVPINDQVSKGRIIAFGRINAIQIDGDVAGDIISYSGGIGSILITNGSFRKGYRIFAGDGDIGSITIQGGHLLGNVEADGAIGSISLIVGADGFVGHIGVASAYRANRAFGPSGGQRNQLPPGTVKTALFDGPTIQARTTIGSITVAGTGKIWETGIFAGESIGLVSAMRIGNDNVTRGLGSFIAAGDQISRLEFGMAKAVNVISGVVSLGVDGRAGGAGGDYDTIRSGTIGDVIVTGKAVNLRIAAGISAANGGLYGNANNKTGPGTSSIGSVTVGAGSRNVKAFADGSVGPTFGAVQRNQGTNLAAVDPSLVSNPSVGAVAIPNGAAFNINLLSGERATVLFTGAGEAFWDRPNGLITLRGTNASSSLRITALDVTLTNLRVLGGNNDSLGTAVVEGTLQGGSAFYLDGELNTATFGTINATGAFGSGGDVQSFQASTFSAGRLLARDLRSLTVTGNFGTTSSDTELTIEALDVGSVTIGGTFAGNFSSDREIDSFTAGALSRAGVRAGKIIRTLNAGSASESRVSARDTINSISIAGNVDSTAFLAGADLGTDASFGGVGRAADVVTDGTIGQVVIGGNFTRSDVAAGIVRGPDGFLGTDDDRADDGRSAIGSVTIGGTLVGSQFNSQQYRVSSTGSVGTVRVGGANFTGTGNFFVNRLTANPVPVQIDDLQVIEDGRVYVAQIRFNQSIDASTLGDALSIFEVRSGGLTIGLAEGVDYTVGYNASTLTAEITFSTSITNRNLPLLQGVPGPGVYRFVLNAAILRGASQSSRLDGNGDGQVGDNFSRDDIVGDAGDKINAGNPAGDPSIDFYGAINLNVVFDDNADSDGLADINRVFTLRGTIGDHPDSNATTFRAGGDTDVYAISLRAGQILRLGGMQGVAQRAGRGIYDASGTLLAANTGLGAFDPNDPFGGLFGNQTGGLTGPILRLPNAPLDEGELSNEDQYLVTVTGTYYIVIAGNLTGANIANVNAINNAEPVPGAVGSYRFTMEIFDDGDTGFGGDTDSGDGTPLVNAPLPIVFAGTDGTFGTADDLVSITTGRYTFTLNRGQDGLPNTRDDIVTGTSSDGVVSTRRSGKDNQWGTRDDVVTQVVNSAIGTPGASGNPTTISPDIDVYHLNDGQPIAPGTRIRVTFQLTETGSNIGLSPIIQGRERTGLTFASLDLLGDTIFGIFEVPAGTGLSDARLVAAPSEFLPIGGQDKNISSTPRNKYGYNNNGDFFIEFITPGAQGIPNPVPAPYAIYLQGAIRSDYTLEVITRGGGNVIKTGQNILLETMGGVIEWLEAGSGQSTRIDPFSTSVLGFSGQIDGLAVDSYVLNNLVANLNAMMVAANLNITISTTPAAFEGQPFSTVFLAGNAEPSQFFNDGTFGASQRVDSFNVNLEDQSVVFLPSFGVLGNDPSQFGVDNLIAQLTAAVGRRIGEMVGLRMESNVGSSIVPTPVMAADSVVNASTVRFVNALRPLSSASDGITDTNFYMGSQNSLALAQAYIAPRF
jgi:hypothetical protein